MNLGDYKNQAVSQIIHTTNAEVNGLELIFTNLRALFLSAEEYLVISDLHLGKTTHFQKNGFAIPKNVAIQDLKNLEILLNHFQPKKLIIAGDFFHASENSELELFKNWKQKYIDKIPFILVKGNHDRFIESRYLALGFELVNHFETDDYIITHQPDKKANKFNIYGHIHPGVVLKGLGKQYVKLPCFLLNDKELILPAFSKFTGLDTGHYHHYNAYAIGEDFVEQV